MFFEVLNAINDPNQQASTGQLEQIIKSIQQLASSQGVNPNQMQLMMTVLGSALNPVLKQKQSQLGAGQLISMLGRSHEESILTSIVPPQLQQQLSQTVAQKTGMKTSTAQSMLPQLLPIVMKLFNMGSPTSSHVGGENSLVSTFLNGKRANHTDLGEVMKFAERFLSANN